MNTYIALIRGINVGGHNKLPMVDLRSELQLAGLDKVQTYIQSGNVIFESNLSEQTKLEVLIRKVIESKFGFEVPILVRSHQDLQRIVERYPFAPELIEKSYFIILNKIPDQELIEAVSEIKFENEQFEIVDDCLYFHSAHGYGRTKFNMKSFENKLQVVGTSRNYKTMLKLLALSCPE